MVIVAELTTTSPPVVQLAAVINEPKTSMPWTVIRKGIDSSTTNCSLPSKATSSDRIWNSLQTVLTVPGGNTNDIVAGTKSSSSAGLGDQQLFSTDKVFEY